MKDLILRYFDAFANLYGIIPMKRAYGIIEKQNPQLNLTREQFADIVNDLDFEGKFYDVLSEDEIYDEDAQDCDLFEKLLIAEYILTFGDPDDYEELVSEQYGRPFYVPEKDELLKYEDEYYFEKTRHYYNLLNFLKDEMGFANAEIIVEDFVASLVIDENPPRRVLEVLRIISEPKFRDFANREQAKKFSLLYTNLRNHTRKHTHRGHTPFELNDCYEADYILENGAAFKVNIPSKNGPCPCGSGKKFKRCCMGKGIYD